MVIKQKIDKADMDGIEMQHSQRWGGLIDFAGSSTFKGLNKSTLFNAVWRNFF